jgi:hypothetical protein
MQGTFILIVIAVYLGLLMLVSYLTSRKGSDNDAFFRANNHQNGMWWLWP